MPENLAKQPGDNNKKGLARYEPGQQMVDKRLTRFAASRAEEVMRLFSGEPDELAVQMAIYHAIADFEPNSAASPNAIEMVDAKGMADTLNQMSVSDPPMGSCEFAKKHGDVGRPSAPLKMSPNDTGEDDG